MWNPFKQSTTAPEPLSIREQLEVLDLHIARLTQRIGALGIGIRNDGAELFQEAPPVASLSDAIEFVNTRVDLLERVIDTMEDKLGF
jgi:prefoldin subunit 5